MSTIKRVDGAGSVVVRIPQNINNRFGILAKRTGRSKTYYLTEALSRYLEDMEDFILAEAAVENTKERLSYGKLAKELGLAD